MITLVLVLVFRHSIEKRSMQASVKHVQHKRFQSEMHIYFAIRRSTYALLQNII